jgi:hypothetical protein
MTYILIILATFVFFLTAIVFGVYGVHYFKKKILLSLGLLFGSIYSAFIFAIQTNGIVSCFVDENPINACVTYPGLNQFPIIQIGFENVSLSLQIFLINVLTLSLVFFLVFFLQRYKHHFK